MSERPRRKPPVLVATLLAAALTAAAGVFWFRLTGSGAGWRRVRFVQPRGWSFGTKRTLVAVPVARTLGIGETARVDFAPTPARPGKPASWPYLEFRRGRQGIETIMGQQFQPPVQPARLLVSAGTKQVGFDGRNVTVLGRTTKFGPIAIDSSPLVTVRR